MAAARRESKQKTVVMATNFFTTAHKFFFLFYPERMAESGLRVLRVLLTVPDHWSCR